MAGRIHHGWGLVILTFVAVPAQAVIIYNDSGPTRNTSAPGDPGLLTAWNYQGSWSGFLGTPIASKYFITAAHVGGTVGGTFNYKGTNYTTIAKYDGPSSDLRIWEVSTAFPDWAPLYTGTDELNKPLFVTGRGTQPGVAVTVSGEPKGWKWGTADSVKSWGSNNVEWIATQSGATDNDDLLAFNFNRIDGVNEAHVSAGDSGGAVFVQQGGVWKLAGINYAVDGYFNYGTTNADKFLAAIFDAGGLYYGDDNNWTYIPNQSYDIPSSAYASRISTNLDWIYTVVPEPSAVGLLSFAALLALRRRRAA
jgi:hypothetical protein